MEYLQYIFELKFILESLSTHQIFAKAVVSFEPNIVLSFVRGGNTVSDWKINNYENFYIDICTAEIYGLENLGVNNGTVVLRIRYCLRCKKNLTAKFLMKFFLSALKMIFFGLMATTFLYLRFGHILPPPTSLHYMHWQ